MSTFRTSALWFRFSSEGGVVHLEYHGSIIEISAIKCDISVNAKMLLRGSLRKVLLINDLFILGAINIVDYVRSCLHELRMKN